METTMIVAEEHGVTVNTGYRRRLIVSMTKLGWFPKYKVTRIDDKAPQHSNCTYFVLDLTHDPFARSAALEYADKCRTLNPNLAADLKRIVESCRNHIHVVTD